MRPVSKLPPDRFCPFTKVESALSLFCGPNILTSWDEIKERFLNLHMAKIKAYLIAERVLKNEDASTSDFISALNAILEIK